jgi:hypothetical protein
MASLDPSIPLQVETPDPFAALRQPLQIASGLQTLRQNQMRLGANQAISDAYRQSVDPNTGEVDFGKLQALASQNGAGAFLPEFMGQIAQQRNSQLQYDTGKLDQAVKQQQQLRSTIGTVLTDPNLGKADMRPAIAQHVWGLVQNGIVPLDMGARELRDLPEDPGRQKEWITNHFVSALSDEAKLRALLPESVAADTGTGTSFFNRAPLTGEMTPNGFVAKGMTAAQLAEPKTITMPDGSQRQVTTAQWLQMVNGANAQPTPPTGSSGAAGGGYTGRYPNGGTSDNAPGTLSSLSPDQKAALAAKGTSSNAAMQDFHNQAAGAPMRLNLLEQARNDLKYGVDKDGNPIKNPLDTGTGSDWRNTAKSFVNSLSPETAKKFGWTGDIARYDQFKKIMTNYASSVSGSLGSGTDARLNAAVSGNANTGISNLANDEILTKTIAAEKMRAAQDYAFQNSGETPEKFNQWQTQWNRNVNPDAFVYASMTPEQRAAYNKRVGSTKSAQTKRDLATLVRSGVIDMGQ